MVLPNESSLPTSTLSHHLHYVAVTPFLPFLRAARHLSKIIEPSTVIYAAFSPFPIRALRTPFKVRNIFARPMNALDTYRLQPPKEIFLCVKKITFQTTPTTPPSYSPKPPVPYHSSSSPTHPFPSNISQQNPD
jgi:hypothetical protein